MSIGSTIMYFNRHGFDKAFSNFRERSFVIKIDLSVQGHRREYAEDSLKDGITSFVLQRDGHDILRISING